MKKIAIFGILLMLSMSCAFAFTVDKTAIVSGDWVWDGSSWTQPMPQPQTAWYTLGVDSPTLHGYYGEVETIGTPWEYDLSNSIITDAPATIGNQFDVVTINPPSTTPGAAYSTYSFAQDNWAGFSESHLNVVGEGAVTVFTSLIADSGVHQNNVVGVN